MATTGDFIMIKTINDNKKFILNKRDIKSVEERKVGVSYIKMFRDYQGEFTSYEAQINIDDIFNELNNLV